MLSCGPCFRRPWLFRLLMLLGTLATFCSAIEAQSSRKIDPAAPLTGTTTVAERDAAVERSLPMRIKPVRVDVDVFEAPVVVTDSLNRAVSGLPKDAFTLLDSGSPQQIQFFSEEDSPMSIALVLDVSNSMTT